MTENKSFMKSRTVQLGLGFGVLGFFLGCGAMVLLQIVLQFGLGGGISGDVIAWWSSALLVGSMWGVPVGLVGAIILGLPGAAIGAGLFSKLNWPVMMKTIVLGIIPSIILAVVEQLRLGSSPETLNSLSTVLLCVSWGGALALFITSGALYGWLAQRSGSPVDIATMASGGAVAALMIGLILGFSNTVAGFVNNQLGSDRSSDMGILIKSIQVTVDAIFGAVGGAIYALIAKNRPRQAE